jgi:hypothetical protein
LPDVSATSSITYAHHHAYASSTKTRHTNSSSLLQLPTTVGKSSSSSGRRRHQQQQQNRRSSIPKPPERQHFYEGVCWTEDELPFGASRPFLSPPYSVELSELLRTGLFFNCSVEFRKPRT